MDQMRPNIVYVLCDNLGFGELGCYGGGILRGAETRRLDRFASEGLKLLNFAPEAQCTPTRSALMTGRYSIRSGTHTVALAGTGTGIVAWERTMGDILSEAGYATACYGKWHIGAEKGRWPIDHGFDEWYGIPRSYDECLWPDDPWYDPRRDPMSYILEGKKGGDIEAVRQLTLEARRDIDLEYMSRAKAFLRQSVEAQKPFFLYFNHSMMHLPTVPRREFEGKTGNDDYADSMLELDSDFGDLLDYLDALGITDDTIIVFSGDNGPEELEPWRGTAGFFDGSYFTGMEGSLRTPCLIRYPGKVPAGGQSNEIVHITDMFTTLLNWAGCQVPSDRIIDGIDQRAFFEGKQENSNREGFLFWNGPTLYGAKWQNFKVKLMEQRYYTDPAMPIPNPNLVNLIVDPKERKPLNYPHLHSWVAFHMGLLLIQFNESVQKEPPIPPGAPLDYTPKNAYS
ncbi:MAG: arylsulfatase [Candidatus Abyssobacteria bacterium SURF_5]|uniref:Arylsulfatase n=1 Tax=Abyssobacteria bacterium (strain SURF_5) TaxID=2093360 RepID=A0A3A4NLI1_ABYX5|nr:MAG: arylsulfatase [Candidatus Abyssubacteria bacterium SURF_5]